MGQVVFSDLDREGLKRSLPGVDVLFVRLRNYIDAEIMDLAPNLRAIVSPTTGLGHIDTEAAAARGVEILSLQNAGSVLNDVRATAEHTIGLILAMLRHIAEAVNHTRLGHWDRDLFRGREIHRKNVGIVGYGRLGRIVARYLLAFDARVLATDRPDWHGSADAGVIMMPLPDLLRQSDIVSLHVNVTPSTRGFFGRACFEAMKPNAYFVNTARGELIDEDALLEALVSGRLAGAALDVLSSEQMRGSSQPSLVTYAEKHSNLILTPHIGGCTVESMDQTERFLASRLCAWLSSSVEQRADPNAALVEE